MIIEMPGQTPEVIPHAERPNHQELVKSEETTLTELARVIAERKALEAREDELKARLAVRFQELGAEKVKLTDIGTFTLTAGKSKKVWQNAKMAKLEKKIKNLKEDATEGVDYIVEAGTPSIIFTPQK